MIYDLTAIINTSTVVYPGDPAYRSNDVCSLKSGDAFNLSEEHFGNHTGTHIDFPAHVISGGKTSDNFGLASLIGDGIIIEVPNEQPSITAPFIKNLSILKNDIVFFKTSNSAISKHQPYTEKYVYLEKDAAIALLEKGVKIVGVDYISIDHAKADDLPVHHTLLSRDVLIVEGLELANAPIGRCKIYIIPLNIQAKDGLPARVFCKK
ncbi:MAG TPA: cyclase family protein [Gammaproteobacteria bacterium]|nr:cyclase family protein [Gammaproteobacteria bacterium]